MTDSSELRHFRGCPRSIQELIFLLSSDLRRYSGRPSPKNFLKHYFFSPGFKCTVWIRLCGLLLYKKWTRYSLYIPAKLILLRLRVKYGIAIPEYTVIGPGLFINRFGGIYVHGDAVIGSNVNMTHGTVLGMMNRGKRPGAPTVGDRVFFGAGAMATGGIHIGDDAAVGARALVTRDVEAHTAVGGNPAVVISQHGSEGYINNQVDPRPYAKFAASRDGSTGSHRGLDVAPT